MTMIDADLLAGTTPQEKTTQDHTARHVIEALRDVEFTLESLDASISDREEQLGELRKSAKERNGEMRQVLRERKGKDGKILADARAMDLALTALEELIGEREEQLAECRKEWKRQVGKLRELVRGSRQGDLPFSDDAVVDLKTGEIKDQSTLTIALPGRAPVTATFAQVEKALDKLEGKRVTLTPEAAAAADRITGDGFDARLTSVGPREPIAPSPETPFTLDDCRFNRKETRRAFDGLVAEKGLLAVIDAIEQTTRAKETLTMASFKAVEELVCRPADEDGGEEE